MGDFLMRLKIGNIGKIGYADILIDGLTMIAGVNNTGKSTVGKALFCLYHGLNRWDDEYVSECAGYVSDIVVKAMSGLDSIIGSENNPPRSSVMDLIKDFFSQPEVIREIADDQRKARTTGGVVSSGHPMMQELDNFIERYALFFRGDNVAAVIADKSDEVDDWKRRLVYKLRDEQGLFEEFLQADYIERNFNRYFNGQYRSLDTLDEPCYCIIDEGNDFFRIDLADAGSRMNEVFHTGARIYYIDSSVVYDRMAILGNPVRGNRPTELMDNILVPNLELMFGDKDVGDIPYYEKRAKWSQETVTKVDGLLKDIRVLIGGASDWSNDTFKFTETNGGGAAIQPHNVSMGIKHLAFLEYVLRHRLINPGDILVMDEPEINMHPDWQLEYAKALVLLEKEMGVRILITTHSPFFIRAVECYTDYYDTMGRLNIYRSGLDETGKAVFDNVMESEWGTPMLYEDYARQYKMLQKIVDEKERL